MVVQYLTDFKMMLKFYTVCLTQIKHCNRVTSADPDDPLTRIVIWVRCGINKIEACKSLHLDKAKCSSKGAKHISIDMYATL